MTAVIPNRSSASVLQSAPDCSADWKARWPAAAAARDEPRIRRPDRGRRARGRATPREGGLVRGGAGADLLGLDLASLELGEEAIHNALLAGLLVQRLAHDPAGQIGGEAAHLGAQRDDGLLALGLDLLLRSLGDPSSPGLRLPTHLGDDRSPLLAGLLADPSGLGAGLGQPGRCTAPEPPGLLLGLLGLLHAALDRGGALGVRLLEVRDDLLGDDPEQDREGDETEDQLTQQGQDRQPLASGVSGGRQLQPA